MLNRTYDTKVLNVRRVTKLIDEHQCDAESSRMEPDGTQQEIAEITALAEDGSATAALIRFNGRHPVSLPADLIVGLDLTVGSRLMLRVRRPEFAGFRGAGRAWHAVGVMAVEER
jgi:hypothetical protein